MCGMVYVNLLLIALMRHDIRMGKRRSLGCISVTSNSGRMTRLWLVFSGIKSTTYPAKIRGQ